MKLKESNRIQTIIIISNKQARQNECNVLGGKTIDIEIFFYHVSNMSDSIYGRARKHWAHARLESITLDSYLQAAVINGVQFPSGSYLSLNSAFDSGQTGYLHTDGSQITVLPATGGGDSELTGDVTKPVGSTVTTLQPVANSKLVEMPALTIKGNPSASMATVEDLTVPQVKTLLNITASDIGGLSSFISSSPTNITLATGVTTAAQEPAHTGDVTNPTGSLVLTISPNAVTNENLDEVSTADSYEDFKLEEELMTSLKRKRKGV